MAAPDTFDPKKYLPFAPGTPVDLVGHSMGGNIAMIYAGLRPRRVHRLVTLEGFGLPGAPPELAPGRYRDWLDQWREPEPAAVEAATSANLS